MTVDKFSQSQIHILRYSQTNDCDQKARARQMNACFEFQSYFDGLACLGSAIILTSFVSKFYKQVSPKKMKLFKTINVLS